MSFKQRLNLALNNFDPFVLTEAQSVSDEKWVEMLKKSPHFKDTSDDLLYDMVGNIRRHIPDDRQHQKYAPYWLNQIARGNLNYERLDEDAQRFINAIEGFIKYSRKKDWEGSKNIYDWKEWRALERKIIAKQESTVDYNKDNDSIIIYHNTYSKKNTELVAQLLGLDIKEMPSSTYWLRQILTCEGAYKYGRGTQWCTAVEPNSERHPATNYLKHGLFIVERQMQGKPRSAILQISGTGDIMQVNDREVTRVKGHLKQFLTDCVSILSNAAKNPSISEDNREIYAETAKVLHVVI